MQQQPNHTSRMATLMGRLRREMNGAVVESMQRAGVSGTLNYGVSIPTIRAIACEVGRDHEFSRFLYRQQVRELRLAAASIADPTLLTPDGLEEWLAGAPTLELLDEVAMRLLSGASNLVLDHLLDSWLAGSRMEACYTALMALNRSNVAPERVWPRMKELLLRFANEMNIARAALAYCTMHSSVVRVEELPATVSGDFVRREFVELFGLEHDKC